MLVPPYLGLWLCRVQAKTMGSSLTFQHLQAYERRLTTEYTEYTEKDKRKTGIGKAGTTERIEGKGRSRAIDHGIHGIHGIHGKRQEEKIMFLDCFRVFRVVRGEKGLWFYLPCGWVIELHDVHLW